MKQIKFLIIIALIFGCNEKESEQKEVVYQNWKSEFQLDSTIEFQGVRHAAYGYTYIYPENFKEKIDTINVQVDSTIFKSENKEAKLKLFVEGEVIREQRKLTQEDKEKESLALIEYANLIKKGKHKLAKDLNIIKSNLRYGYYGETKPARLEFLGEKGDKEIIWGIELSEIPVSGDLTFKNMYFEYPKLKKEFYNPIGIEMLNNFGMN